jgi:drug/metabolite transporter (DMT)-like permease
MIAMLLWFGAIAIMPIADATAISFAQPLFISGAAVLFLAEPMRASRWLGLTAGFAGAMVILRPGFAAVNIGAMMVLGGAVFIAASAIMVKVAARDDPPDMIAMYQVFYMIPMTLIPAAFFWMWPSWDQLFLAAMVAVFTTYAQRAYTRSFAATDASAVTPFDFMRLPFSAGLGLVLFAELPDPWTVAGGAVIFVASTIVVRGERRPGKKPRDA